MDDNHFVSTVGGTGADAPDHSRRGFLECMTWAGVGVLWTITGGIPRSRLIGAANAATPAAAQCRRAAARRHQPRTADLRPNPAISELWWAGRPTKRVELERLP